MHLPDACTPWEETLRTFDDLVRCGKVRYIGASNMKGWQVQKVADLCKHWNYSPFVTLQVTDSRNFLSSNLPPFSHVGGPPPKP